MIATLRKAEANTTGLISLSLARDP
jgi:hypothetical protein